MSAEPSLTAPITAAMCAAGRVVAEPRLSPDGAVVAFVTATAEGASLVVLPVDGGPERVVTAGPAPTRVHQWGGGAYCWSLDGARLIYASGLELWSVAVDGGPPTLVVHSDAGPLGSPVVSPAGDWVAYVADGGAVRVAPIDPAAGSSWLVSSGTTQVVDPTWGEGGRVVLWHEWDDTTMPWDDSRIMAAPADGGAPPTVVAGGPGVSVAQPRCSPDGSLVAFLSDANGWLNLWVGAVDGSWQRPVLAEAHEHGRPTWGPGIRTFAWAPDASGFALARDEDGFGSLWLIGPDGHESEQRQLGRAVHGGIDWVGEHVVAIRSGARTPTQLVTYRVAEGDDSARRVLAVGPVAGFEAADRPEPEVVHWLAEDGETIEGRLHRTPREVLGSPPPLIVWVHGGPTDRWPVHFNARIAYWVVRGWNVLVPDHRGSTGHGRAFTQALRGRWGELDVADVAAGIQAGPAAGWGDADRIVAMGGSAGGFCVLHLLASWPGLVAAGVAVSPVTDVAATVATTHRFERHYFESLVGPLPGSEALYRQRSPLHRVDAIVDPVLVLHGTDDRVVGVDQSVALVDRLTALGRVVECHLYAGEGHGFRRTETLVDELVRTEAFLDRYVLSADQ